MSSELNMLEVKRRFQLSGFTVSEIEKLEPFIQYVLSRGYYSSEQVIEAFSNLRRTGR
jgi:hypothetical protein